MIYSAMIDNISQLSMKGKRFIEKVQRAELVYLSKDPISAPIPAAPAAEVVAPAIAAVPQQ